MLELGEAGLGGGELGGGGLVGVAVLTRARLLVAQGLLRDPTTTSQRHQDEAARREPRPKSPHWIRLIRSIISSGGMKPVTRPGPSCGTAHSRGWGSGSLHAISRTVGSPG